MVLGGPQPPAARARDFVAPFAVWDPNLTAKSGLQAGSPQPSPGGGLLVSHKLAGSLRRLRTATPIM